MTDETQSGGLIISIDTTKKKSGKAPKIRKKRDAALHPPRKNYRVLSTNVKDKTVLCEYTPRTVRGKSKMDEFECSSVEHAKLFSEHVPKIHARWRMSSLCYTLKKYAGTDGYELLLKARQRAIKKKDYRRKVAAENARIRRAQEADMIRKKMALGSL